MKRSACVFTTALALVTGTTVKAAPITYNFTGTVTQLGLTSPGVNVGDAVPISITVNDPGTGGPNYSYTAGSPGTPLISSALFGGVSYTSLFQSISVQVGSSISFLTTVPMTNLGFSLVLTGARNGALPTGALPTALNSGDFTGGTFNVEQVFEVDQRYSGTINGIGGISIVPVPEPGSWLLFGAGFVGTMWHAGRRWRGARATALTFF